MPARGRTRSSAMRGSVSVGQAPQSQPWGDALLNRCPHRSLSCLNQYEIVRKYRCDACGEVMMCSCDLEFGERFLPHQLHTAKEHGTQRRVDVTLGFVEDVCNTCRGLPETSAPKAPLHGRTSKIKRYYWREISMLTTTRFGDWLLEQGDDRFWLKARQEHKDVQEEIEREVVEEIKALHAKQPKYSHSEQSQSEILKAAGVEVQRLDAVYSRAENGRVAIQADGEMCSVEEYVSRHLRSQGWDVLFLESVPFHVLFGVFMWLLIQHPADPHVRVVSFGDRKAYEAGRKAEPIFTPLPDDFGTSGYARRRAAAIDEHFDRTLPDDRSELLWLFDYWLGPSSDLRQYLWAHRQGDIERARAVLQVLPADTLLSIMRYLVGDYWSRYCGWPDLLAHRPGDFRLVEVKSSSDKLSENQKRWILDNYATLRIPFVVVKVHRTPAVGDRSA